MFNRDHEERAKVRAANGTWHGTLDSSASLSAASIFGNCDFKYVRALPGDFYVPESDALLENFIRANRLILLTELSFEYVFDHLSAPIVAIVSFVDCCAFTCESICHGPQNSETNGGVRTEPSQIESSRVFCRA